MEDKTSLGQRIVKGALWTVLMRWSVRLLGIISVLILARLLVPADFGLVAKAVMVSGFLELISQFGFSAALIRNQQADRHDYDTVWTLTIMRALAIALLLILFSSPLATFLNEPELQLMFCCYGLATLIGGFTNVGIVDFHKQMQFHLDFKFQLYLKLSSFITTLAIAFVWQSYWAFPLGLLVRSMVSVLISYRLSAYRPSLSLSRWRNIFDFSKWMFFYELQTAVSTKLDTFILSRYASTEHLGLFTVANEVASTPTTEIAQPVARATLPGLSKINDQPQQFREMYAAIVSNVLLFAVPAGLGVSLLSEPITAVLLGIKWYDAAPYIEWLALSGIAMVVSSITVSAMVAAGKVSILSKFSSLRLVLRLLLLPLGMYLGGSLGLCAGIFAAGIINMLITLLIQHRIGIISLTALTGLCWRLCVASAVMYICLAHGILPAIGSGTLVPLVQLMVEIVSGALIYGVTLWILWAMTARQDGPEQQLFSVLQTRLSPSK